MDTSRLLYEDPDDFTAELLRVGKSDGIPSHSRQAILAALGVVVPVIPMDATATSTGNSAAGNSAAGNVGAGNVGAGTSLLPAAAASGATKGLVALVAAGLVGGAAIWGYAPSGSQEHPPTPTPVVAAGPSVDPVQIASADDDSAATEPGTSAVEATSAVSPSSEGAALVEDNDLPTRQKRAVTAAPAGGSLSEELALVESARSALGQGNAGLALRRLASHKKLFPKGSLRSEATMLRIEALLDNGDRAAATRLGRAVLKASPNGPYSRRIHSLLGDADDDQ